MIDGHLPCHKSDAKIIEIELLDEIAQKPLKKRTSDRRKEPRCHNSVSQRKKLLSNNTPLRSKLSHNRDKKLLHA